MCSVFVRVCVCVCVCVHHISQQTKSENRVTEREWSVKMQETDSSIAPLNLALLH